MSAREPADALVAFLTARLDEDEAQGRRVQAALDAGWNYFDEIPTQLIDPARVLREVAAKRAILAAYEEAAQSPYSLPPQVHDDRDPADKFRDQAVLNALEDVVMALAAVWSDHPAYDPAWAASLG